MPRPIERAERSLAFVLSWVAYATYYLGRKSYSVTKARIRGDLGFGETDLATLDTVYLAAYALGQFLNGALGDRVGARRLVGVGMLVSAVACAVAGLGHGMVIFLLAFAVNGWAQSTGWPGTTKVMAAFTTVEDRGAVMGVWSTCYQVGGVVATALASFLLARRGWRAAFIGPSLCVAAVGAVVLRFMPERPSRSPTASDDPDPLPVAVVVDDLAVTTTTAVAEKATQRAERRALRRSIALWSYGCCYFALKLIRYSLMFWLPYYLFKVVHFTEAQAGYLSTSFEVGGVAGAAGLGLASDRWRRLSRPAWAALSSLLLAAALLLYARLSPDGWLANAALVALVGALLFGPDALVAGAAAQDLAGPSSAATATGIVNGVGSVGAILQGYLTVTVSQRYGWGALFSLFVWLALAGAACLIPAILAHRSAKRSAPAPSSSVVST